MGTVTHTINVIHADGASKVVLDSSGLLIDSVTDGEGRVLHHQLSDRHSKFGTAINIQFKHINEGETQVIKVNYETTKECTALQWLKPAQTVGLKFPYMFSQCQAIHARSLFPCQDTPGVKFTYSGNVKSSIQDLVVLMSAVNEKPHNNVFTFEQKVAVPSYLVAIAVGNLKGISVGPRTTVWSEPEVVEQAAWEFEDTEDFLKIGEELLTPYEWGIYDLLILPASFPYGGMENPCLTFVTPTLLAGDRSLVDVVAHEIAHSWMGNLVTTVSWEHFWLNEGFTVFIERKITSKRSGEPV